MCSVVAVCHAVSLYARRPDNLATDTKDGQDLTSTVKYLVRAEERGLRLRSHGSADICVNACLFFLCLTSLSVRTRVYLQGKADKCKETTTKATTPKASTTKATTPKTTKATTTTPEAKCIVTIWAKDEGNCAVCALCV